MATITPTIVNLQSYGNTGVHTYSFTPMTHTGSDAGAPIEMPGSADRSVQVFGTFGTGGNLRIEGSMDGNTWATLTDPQGNALDFTTAKIETIMEITRYIRPRITAGDGSTSLTCIILIRRPVQ
jgi:hypothetical protein